MRTFRTSASELDQYSYYLSNDDMPLQVFLERLRKKEPPTDRMLAGRAWHKFLENAGDGSHDSATQDGFKFKITADADFELPPVRELKAVKNYRFGDLAVTLVGVVDGMAGRRVIDHKLTWNPNLDRLVNAWQWRCYLEIFGADIFEYMVYTAKDIKGDARDIEVSHIERFDLYRYPDMGRDIECFVADFAAFVEEWLPERIPTIYP